MEPKIVDAGGVAVSSVAVRTTLRDLPETPSEALLHPAQMAMWEEYGITMSEILVDTSPQELDIPDFSTKVTMGGIPVRVDLRMPQDEIHFRRANGELLGKVVSLAIPKGR